MQIINQYKNFNFILFLMLGSSSLLALMAQPYKRHANRTVTVLE